MRESKNSSHGSQRRRRLNRSVEDRLTSLPDSILTHILSLLPITSAATTSVLSRRWRRLWTGITSFHLDLDLSEHTSHSILSLVLTILPQLTSPKLHLFYLVFPSESNLDHPDATSPCFRALHRRNVDHIIFNAGFRSFFRVPAASLFASHSLVSLKLIGLLKIDDDLAAAFDLPKLKNLSLCYLLDVPLWLGTVFKSCQLLEHLELSFDLVSLPQPQIPHSLVNVFSPNLKSLKICMSSWPHLQPTQISIDAPNLESLEVRDSNSFYYFLQNPTSLSNASIDLRADSLREFSDSELEDGEDNYVNRMLEFLGRMTSVCNLELQVDNRTDIFTRLHHGSRPIFRNVSRFKTNCFKDLLLCLQCLPNLEHLEVSLWSEDYNFAMEQMNWCTPDSLPDCFVSKLKTVQIGGMKGIDNELKLLEYILSNAMVLEKLCIEIRVKLQHEKECGLWKEGQFCKLLFNLPRCSSTCEVVSRSVAASGPYQLNLTQQTKVLEDETKVDEYPNMYYSLVSMHVVDTFKQVQTNLIDVMGVIIYASEIKSIGKEGAIKQEIVLLDQSYRRYLQKSHFASMWSTISIF